MNNDIKHLTAEFHFTKEMLEDSQLNGEELLTDFFVRAFREIVDELRNNGREMSQEQGVVTISVPLKPLENNN